MAMSIVDCLGASLGGNNELRAAATETLASAERDNYPQYMHTLASVLAEENPAVPMISRNAAGLAFKNALTNRNWTIQNTNYIRWRSLDAPLRQSIKSLTLTTLASPSDKAIRNTAAQVVSAIAAAELPEGLWDELIQRLLEFVQGENTGLRIATLQCIGYICEGIPPAILASRSNEILTAVVQGARKEEPSAEVQTAAIQALLNSLEFIRDNFDREGERNYIMQVVCEATQSPAAAVQVGAYECLVRIMQLYYDKMSLYMERALFGLTILGMQNPNSAVALQAIEFWSTVCDEEAELSMEAAEAAEFGEAPDLESRHFARTALPEILPVLLNLMLKQDEDADEDDWDISKSAGTCVALLAQVAGDSIVQPVIPFIEQNIQGPDWHQREAAVMVFGSILDGPDAEKLGPLVQQALPTLIGMMRDPHPNVKDTTAWTLGRITELMNDVIQRDVHLAELITALEFGLKESSRIAANAAWAIQNLAASFGDDQTGDSTETTSALSPYFGRLMTTLMQTGQERDAGGNTASSARTAVYTAIADLINSSTMDVREIVAAAGSEICVRIENLLSVQNQIVGADDRNNWNDMQSNYCQVLQAIIRKLGRDISLLEGFTNRVMGILLRLLQDSGKDQAVAEDAFVSINAVIQVLETNFSMEYVQAMMPFVYKALATLDEYQVFTVVVGTMGDLARGIGKQFTPLANDVLNALLTALASPVLHRSAKPPVVAALGDIATALDQDFTPYLDGVMQMLMQAGQVKVEDDSDNSMEDFVWNMREAITEAFTGIVAAYAENAQPLLPYVSGIVTFAVSALDDGKNCSDSQLKASYNLLGDIAQNFRNQPSAKDFLLTQGVTRVITMKAKKGVSKGTANAQKYARKAIKDATA